MKHKQKKGRCLNSLDSLVLCPYCGELAELIDSVEIYGRSYGQAWICKPCDAYVGCHKGTSKPLGRLADRELRTWKKKAHSAFDPLWKTKQMTRGAAYRWLAKELNMSRADCHIGMMDVSQCKSVVGACTQNEKDQRQEGADYDEM